MLEIEKDNNLRVKIGGSPRGSKGVTLKIYKIRSNQAIKFYIPRKRKRKLKRREQKMSNLKIEQRTIFIKYSSFFIYFLFFLFLFFSFWSLKTVEELKKKRVLSDSSPHGRQKGVFLRAHHFCWGAHLIVQIFDRAFGLDAVKWARQEK